MRNLRDTGALCWLLTVVLALGCSGREQPRTVSKAAETGVARAETPKAEEAPSWTDEGWHKDVHVFTRVLPGAKVREVMAVGEIKAPSWRVWRVLGDYDNYHYFMPFTKESRTVHREGNTVWFFSWLHFPLGIGDRCYTIRLTHSEKGKGEYESQWDLAKEHAVASPGSVIQTPVNQGGWHLVQNGADSTTATYTLMTDPGGMIPAWLANVANKQAVPDIFKAIRNRVTDPAYGETAKK